MANVPAVVSKRLIANIPKFKKILESARKRDVNESDTVTIVTDMLEQVFGFDKYTEITREFKTQGLRCDFAIKSGEDIEYLLEVKAIGSELKSSHLNQAVGYAIRQGIKWAMLTNGINWEIHRVDCDGKVSHKRLFHFDFLELNPKNNDHQQMLFLLCKRGVAKDLITEYYEYKQSVNRYTIGAVLLTDPVLGAVRREIRRMKAGLKVSTDDVKEMISSEVLKRDLVESEDAERARKQVAKAMKKHEKSKAKADGSKDREPIAGSENHEDSVPV
ncbi:MAG: type I restriction enzyme HsdR N-terminal domain-containing protein [Gammaproteobacteria bacterium]|nr:type I restriction enzyme HsdR N-terminal domain-containing protein [Gammaproteobacteria bacterium]